MKNPYNITFKNPAKKIFPNNPNALRARTEDKWKKRKANYLSIFSKRLRRDLQYLPSPKFPSLDFQNGQGLFIHGVAGSGKTVYAAQLLMDIAKYYYLNYRDDGLLFESVPTFLANLKQSFGNDTKSNFELIDQLQTTYILVLDDLGVSGKPSDWLLETLYLLINYRYEHLLPTIYTSNLNLQGIAELYGDVRIASRIDRSCKVLKKKHWKNTND